MDFKIFKIIFASILTVFCMGSSCGLRIGETYADPVFSGTKLGCMNKLRDQFDSYIKQDLKDGELGVFAKCLTTAFTVFKLHVWGEERGNYSPKELRSFIHEFFLQDTPVSDELLNHLMVFKTALVGGSTESLTLNEIDQINERIQVMGQIMADIYPYNHILFGRAETSFEELNKSTKVIQKASSEFSNKIFQKPYSLESAGRLLQGISQLMDFSSDQNFLWLRALKGFAPFILSSSSKKDIILPQEWPVLLVSMTDLISILLHVNATVKQGFFDQKILHVSKSFEVFLKFLKDRMKAQSIKKEDIMKLVQYLKEENVIPENIQYTSLESVIDAVFGKIISQSEGDFSFGEEEFLWLENFYQTWNQLQQDIYSAVWDEDWKESVSEENVQIITELSRFKSLYKAKKDESEENENIYVYLTYPSLVKEDSKYKNLIINSIYWFTTQAVLRGYAEYPEYGLVEGEFGNLLKDFRGLISDLSGFISAPAAEIENYGRTEFIAGHLMLYETEGFYADDGFRDSDQNWVEVVSQREGTEFLSLTGFIIRTLGDVSQEFHKKCSESITRDCFIDHVLSVVQNISLKTMPQLNSFLNKITEEEKDKYAELLFEISVVDPEQIASLEFLGPVHLRNLVFILLYQEVTMTRYDFSAEGVLDKEELMGDIYYLYDGLIEHFGVNLFCRNSEEFKDKVGFLYNYIIRHLRLPPPDMKDLSLEIIWEWAVQSLNMWDVELSRIELTELALLLVQTMRAKSKEIQTANCN